MIWFELILTLMYERITAMLLKKMLLTLPFLAFCSICELLQKCRLRRPFLLIFGLFLVSHCCSKGHYAFWLPRGYGRENILLSKLKWFPHYVTVRKLLKITFIWLQSGISNFIHLEMAWESVKTLPFSVLQSHWKMSIFRK